MRLKLLPKIALILISLATLPAILVGWKTYSLNKEHIETSVLELHTNLSDSLADKISRYLESQSGKVNGMIDASRLQGIVSRELMRAFLSSNPDFISVAYTDPSGRELLKETRETYPSEKMLRDRRDEPAFDRYLLQSAQGFAQSQIAYGFSLSKTEPRLSVVLPFNRSNPNRGAFFALVSMTDFWNSIASEGAGIGGGGREALVVDENGIVIAHSRDFQMVLNRVSLKDNPMVSEALQKRSAGSREYKDSKGRSIIGSYSTVATTGWAALIQQPKLEAYAAIYETRKNALRIVLISIAIAAVTAFIFAKTLSRPIFALIEGARKVARGEFDHNVRVGSRDEISDLAKTFNEMVQELRRYSDMQVDRLIEEKTKTESVIYSIADGIILTNQQGDIQLLNKQAITIFGLNAPSTVADPGPSGVAALSVEQELIGKNLFEVLSDLKIKQSLHDLLVQPDQPIVKEIAIGTEDYLQHYQLSAELVYTPRTARKIGVVTVIHDVTLERQMDEIKESFLHSITHDLRNPMTSIMGFLKFLLDETAGPINDQQKQMLTTMDRASTRLLGMINDILDIAKIEAGKLELELSPVSMVHLLNDIMDLYKPLAYRKTIHLTLELAQEVRSSDLVLQADLTQIERVVGNLVANAIKFTPGEGSIVIRLVNEPERVLISVQDSGPGIPEEYREKVFDKFQQVKGQRRGGTGLGLTISKYFVELHKGEIWVDSQFGKGSCFTFWIPKNLERSSGGAVLVRKAVAT